MPENQSENFDVQLQNESIQAGEQKLPEVNVEDDYEASKQFSGGVSAEAAEAATAPKFRVSQPQETTQTTQETGDPGDFRAMAKDINPSSEASSTVSDELVEKALEKGQSAQ
ncbi:hypothetical protein [Microcoleus sp. FACHB-68]|uniref:hypothetical protein n=1 Tax=Microcoleus sp. FACHB-68 TaxID=2692826 RepID=UPI001683EA6D|nr:hypothetical protein [Microcoleus sp. FACHB-68]MBD1937170.1 hypothetical protein [Microcoleus sp. FACHB-68]